MSKQNNITDNKKNKNINDIGKDDDNVSFLISKAMIIVIVKELVTIIIVTVNGLTLQQ